MSTPAPTHELAVPADKDAEMAVLGSILLDNTTLREVANIITPEAFYWERHRVLYAHMTALDDAGDPIDIVTLADRLRVKGDLERIGSVPYIIGLGDSTPTSAYAEHYARIVQEKAVLRDIIATSRRAISLATSGDGTPTDIIAAAQAEITHLLVRGTRGDFQGTAELASEVAEYIEELGNMKDGVSGVHTGFADLDHRIRGWQKGALYTIAARPSMGKTAFALNSAYHAAYRGKKVGLFSLEMPNRDLALRIVCSEARVSMERVRDGTLTERDYQRIVNMLGAFSNRPLMFNDLADITMNELRAKARTLAARDGLDLLVVDYLQLIGQDGNSDRSENRVQEVSKMTRGFKMLARELDIPVLLLSQLSRQVEARPNKRPMLSDLRESGSIEQDSDVVIFLYRDDYYDPNSENAGIAEVIIGKQRNGPIGTVKLQWTADHAAFRDLAQGAYTSAA